MNGVQLRRDEERLKRPERERRDRRLRLMVGRLIGMVKNSGGILWFGFNS